MSEEIEQKHKGVTVFAWVVSSALVLAVVAPISIALFRDLREDRLSAERQAKYEVQKAEWESKEAARREAEKYKVTTRDGGARMLTKEVFGTKHTWYLAALDEPGHFYVSYDQESKEPGGKKSDRSSSVVIDMVTAAEWMELLRKAEEWRIECKTNRAPDLEKPFAKTVNVGGVFRWSHSFMSTNWNLRRPETDGDQWINIFEDDLEPLIFLLGETSAVVKEKLAADVKAAEFAEKLN
jgi:hypothetical protein